MGRSFETGNFAAAGAGTTTFNTPLGYRAGAGGTVTQETSKGTSVELNTLSGRITMHNQTLAAGAAATFLFGNNLAGEHDVLLVSFKEYGGANENYTVTTMTRNGGNGFFISVRNASSGSLSDALPLNFVVLKGAVV
jgi:hypothetical protein